MATDYAEVVFSAAAKAALLTLFKALSSKDKTKPKEDLDLVQQRLRIQAAELSRVKTLLATDVAVPIDRFYCSPRLIFGTRQLTPSASREFRDDRVLIEGVAGQGKSILLRHLCSTAVLREGKIAFFYELRQVDWNKPLVRIVLDSLAEIGLRSNVETLKTLAAQRDIEIYLDGFDEVDQKAAAMVDVALDYFAQNHPFLKVFVSSRPHAGLAKSDSVAVYRISDLNRADVDRLIDKLSPDAALASTLKTKLNANSAKAAELLETPLLVTLLVHRYSRTQQIPEQLSEFYDDVFPLLFDRHDQFKVGFLRKRRVAINTSTYKKIFQKFCYYSLFAAKLTDEIAIKIADASQRPYAADLDSADFLCDVSEISALLFEERAVWSFIHASVQEYYAAAYLLSLPDNKLEERALDLGKMENFSTRDQVCRFGREIDPYRFTRFVDVPLLRSWCEPLSVNVKLDDANVVDWLAQHAVQVSFDKNLVPGGKFFSVRTKESEVVRLFAREADLQGVESVMSSSQTAGEKIIALSKMPTMSKLMSGATRPKVEPYIKRWQEALELLDHCDEDFRRAEEFLDSLLARDDA